MAKSPAYKEILSKAQNYCASQERCVFEVRQRLAVWQARPTDALQIIESLTRDGFLDEARFAFLYVQSKVRLKKWGRHKIRHELRSRQLAEMLIEQALSAVVEEQYHRNLYDLARRKWHAIKVPDIFSKSGKLATYLTGKGYETDLVWSCVREISGQPSIK